MKKELWIRAYETKEIEDIQKFILSLGDEGLLGEIPVKLFFYNTMEIKTLSHIYDVSDKALIPLYEKYGEMNVKILEHADSGSGQYEESEYTDEDRCINEDQLTRIADALETINGNLADMAEMLESIDEKLSGCISHVGNNNFLCVTGNISTY